MEHVLIDGQCAKTDRLIGDVGGTNARFALLSGNGVIHSSYTLVTSEYPTITQAIRAYLELVGTPIVTEAAIAIANPVHGERICMTNHDWAFSIEETRQELSLTHLLFKNDFAALAMSVPLLQENELQQIGGEVSKRQNTLAVIGPGTGLGVSGLLREGGSWIAVCGEGGHVSISPGNQRELAILRVCWEEFSHVSAERLVSGMGLQNIYRAICKLENKLADDLTPADISSMAISAENVYCEESLAIFCALLGSVAGNLVLTLGAFDGVYIGGGIVPKLGDYFRASEFRSRFEAKGRFVHKLAPVPAYVIKAKYPALIGIGQSFVV